VRYPWKFVCEYGVIGGPRPATMGGIKPGDSAKHCALRVREAKGKKEAKLACE
jgi:hypothetical protein